MFQTEDQSWYKEWWWGNKAEEVSMALLVGTVSILIAGMFNPIPSRVEAHVHRADPELIRAILDWQAEVIPTKEVIQDLKDHKPIKVTLKYNGKYSEWVRASELPKRKMTEQGPYYYFATPNGGAVWYPMSKGWTVEVDRLP